MFTLMFESKERILLTRYSGMFTSDDLAELDAFIPDFVKREGHVRNILDFTEVEAVAVPLSKLLLRGRRPWISPGQERVIVAPDYRTRDLASEYARLQRDIGNGNVPIVATLTEAFDFLNLKHPDFHPVVTKPTPGHGP